MARFAALLEGAERPLVILGGTRWTDEAYAQMVAFSERYALRWRPPSVVATAFPAEHPNYAGDVGIGANPKLRRG